MVSITHMRCIMRVLIAGSNLQMLLAAGQVVELYTYSLKNAFTRSHESSAASSL